jgi:amino-acid N-acetyltransferase
MTQLYLEEYRRALAGQPVLIACREGILRSHVEEIIEDIKFLSRQGVATVFLHNVSNRVANRKLFALLALRLADTRIVRFSPDLDFYHQVLNFQPEIFKLIFLERKALVDPDGQRINCLTTLKTRQRSDSWKDLIANTNFKAVLEQICEKIDAGSIQRVHILAAGKDSIKHELFSIEGSGTLIANNFSETFSRVQTDEEVRIVSGILKMYRGQRYLKPRSPAYISEHRCQFFVAKIDGIIVGCLEKIVIDAQTVELGALAISTKFRNQQVGLFLIDSFLDQMRAEGFSDVISLTRNPRLAVLYKTRGFSKKSPPRFARRQAASPRVQMYVKTLARPATPSF